MLSPFQNGNSVYCIASKLIIAGLFLILTILKLGFRIGCMVELNHSFVHPFSYDTQIKIDVKTKIQE